MENNALTRTHRSASTCLALTAAGFAAVLLSILPARSAPPDSEDAHRRAGEVKRTKIQRQKDGFAQPAKTVWYTPTPEERARWNAERAKRREISDAFAAKNYKQVLSLIAAETDRDFGAESRYGSERLRAIAHVNFPDFKRRVRLSLANTSGSTSTYLMYCNVLVSDKDLTPEVYRFGRDLVDEAVQKKQIPFWFLRIGAQMDANQGDLKAAVATQTAAIAAADADPRCHPFIRKNLRDTLAKLEAEAGK